MAITVHPVADLPLIEPGDDLAALIAERFELADGDILCLASSVYSKAKGHLRDLGDVTPTPRAAVIAGRTGEEPASSRSCSTSRRSSCSSARSSSRSSPTAISASAPASTSPTSRATG